MSPRPFVLSSSTAGALPCAGSGPAFGASDPEAPVVVTEDLVRTFRVRRREPGFRGAVRGLFGRGRTTTVVTAVDRVSFRIGRGERVAFVGPNGAGKSTTIRMLAGILRPTSGSARVLSTVPWEDRRRLAFGIGTVFGQRSQLWTHLPPRDTFELLAGIYELDRTAARARLARLADVFELGKLLDRPVRTLSLGERMRCEIVASLLHRPAVVFLDEPTIGLDVTAKAAIRDVVRRMAEEDGSTVLLTSHDTGDMEQVCDRVIAINGGRVVVDGPVRDLRSRFVRRKRVTCVTVDSAALGSALPGVVLLAAEPHRTTFEVDTSVTPVEALLADVIGRARLADLSVEDPPMDEIVTMLYAQTTAAGTTASTTSGAP